MKIKKIPIPSKEYLELLFYYNDGKLISIYPSRNGKRKAGEPAGYLTKYGYRAVKVNSKSYAEHRLIWVLLNGDLQGFEIDHINGARHDNRIENLRLVTRQQNNWNLRSAKITSKTGLLGACYHAASGKYVAQIQDHGKYRHIGCFTTAEEAHQAYMQEKQKIHKISNNCVKD